MIESVDIAKKFEKLEAFWSPKIIGEMNGQYIMIAKLKDELVWHSHENEDELFIIQKGTLIMDFIDKTVEVKAGSMLLIPKGVEHRPRTNGEEVWTLLIEPKTTLHTGNVRHDKTVDKFEWLE